MTKNLVEILKEFQGIIGTGFGVVLTLVTSKLLANMGKIKFFFTDASFSYKERSKAGGSSETSIDFATTGTCKFNMEIYNNSDSPKVLRDLKVEVITMKNKFDKRLEDKSTAKHLRVYTRYDELVSINLPPKQIVSYELKFNLNQSDFVDDSFEEIKQLILVGAKTNGRNVKKVIWKKPKNEPK